MTDTPTYMPTYIIHHIDEDDVTVDWFFGTEHHPKRAVQLGLVLIGWFFAVLPVEIDISALTHPHGGGWWSYREGFVMWEVTMATLGILIAFFIFTFLTLYLVNRSLTTRRNKERTYDQERLALRLELADELYANKYGVDTLRLQRKNVHIEPYGDVETFELRDLYHAYGVD